MTGIENIVHKSPTQHNIEQNMFSTEGLSAVAVDGTVNGTVFYSEGCSSVSSPLN